jgi:hypothetical protein
MRAALISSILLNVTLLLFLVRKPAPPPAPQVAADQPAAAASASKAPVAKRPDDAPFSWSRLESADYRVYIANLRSIGCPEQTIRDIITADVHNLFQARKRELEQQAARTKGISPGPSAAQSSPEDQSRKLPEDERSLIAMLLGPDPEAPADDVPSLAAFPRRPPPVDRPISMPLVFADVDVTSLHLDDSRAQVISILQKNFLEKLGGEALDPNDPAYLQRWQQAQPEIDEMLKTMIGINAYQQYDLAARASLRGAPAEAP